MNAQARATAYLTSSQTMLPVCPTPSHITSSMAVLAPTRKVPQTVQARMSFRSPTVSTTHAHSSAIPHARQDSRISRGDFASLLGRQTVQPASAPAMQARYSRFASRGGSADGV